MPATFISSVKAKSLSFWLHSLQQTKESWVLLKGITLLEHMLAACCSKQRFYCRRDGCSATVRVLTALLQAAQLQTTIQLFQMRCCLGQPIWSACTMAAMFAMSRVRMQMQLQQHSCGRVSEFKAVLVLINFQ